MSHSPQLHDNENTALRKINASLADGSTGQGTCTTFSSTSTPLTVQKNLERKLLTVFNEGPGNLYVLYGDGTPSAANYSVRMATGDYLEVDKYNGVTKLIFSGSGVARITDIT